MEGRPNFLEPPEFPWLAEIAAQFEAVRAEAEEVIGRYRYLRFRYPEHFTQANPMVQGHRATFYLEMYGVRLGLNRAFCPRAAQAVAGVPGLVTSAIYLLEAKSRILPHRGATNLVLRGHLGLISPPGSFLRVDQEVRGWTEGGFLVFDDTAEHEAWNETDQCRAILMFDFFRPDCPQETREAHLRELRGRLPDRELGCLVAGGGQIDDEEFMERLRAPSSSVLAEVLRPMAAGSGMYLQ